MWKHLLPAGETTRRIPLGIAAGVRIGIDFHGGQIRTYLGTYELELARSFWRLCRKGDRSFDVGAGFGYYTLAIAKRTRAPVLSLECDDASCQAIRRNADANPMLAPLVVVRQALVGSKKDEGETTLDAVADEVFAPDFIKMDIEGAEARALAGASTLLATKHPRLIVEVHGLDIEHECVSTLRSHGYRVTIVDRRRVFPEGRPLDHNRWLLAI